VPVRLARVSRSPSSSPAPDSRSTLPP
jgi:hypothetical protein